jgi:O-antigen/teichoic acid export membrane protein
MPLIFLTNLITINVLGPDIYGVLAVLNTVVYIFFALSGMGIDESFPYNYKNLKQDIEQIIFSKMVVTIFFASIFAIFILYFFDIFKFYFLNNTNVELDLNNIKYLLLIWLPAIVFFTFFDLILVLKNHMKFYFFSFFGLNFLRLILTVILVYYLKLSIEGALLSIVLSYFISIFVFIIWLNKNFLKKRFIYSSSITRDLISRGKKVYLLNLLAILHKRVDVLLIGFFLSTADVGYYSIATLIIIVLLQDLSRSTMWPLIRRLTDFDTDEKDITPLMIKFLLHLNIIIIIFLWIFSPYIVFFIFGEDFGPSIICINLLALSLLGTSFNIPSSGYFVSIGSPGYNIYGVIFCFLTLIILNILLIPILGIKGAAISSSSSQIIMAIINLHYLSHKIGIPKRDFILLNNKDISLFSEFVGSFFRKTK